MKVWFWKNAGELILHILSIFLFFVLFIIGLIITILNTENWPFLFFSLIMLLGSLITVKLNTRILTRVGISEIGIEWWIFKQKVDSMKWIEIIELKETVCSRTSCWLTLISINNKIDLDLTKKMYDTIMILCPSVNIKNTINNMESFKCFHKKDKKSPE